MNYTSLLISYSTSISICVHQSWNGLKADNFHFSYDPMKRILVLQKDYFKGGFLSFPSPMQLGLLHQNKNL